MELSFTLNDLFTLFMLIMLQLVLGFDNLLYISLESKNAPPEKQAYARKVGILMAIVLRIILLFGLVQLIDKVQDVLFHIPDNGFIAGHFNLHSIIVLIGGVFILYTAIKEIWHMTSLEDHNEVHDKEQKQKSVGAVITMIIIMNLVFSFDSILSAMALTKNFLVMALAIIIGGVAMVWLADRVASFLAKNRMYEVLGLFILFLVGIMLISEGGHLAHLDFTIAGTKYPVTPMSKATFYFILVILVIVDVVQGRYQQKLLANKEIKQ